MSSNDSKRSYKGIDRREFLRAGLAVGVAGAVATAAADIRDEMAGSYKPLDPGRKVKIGVVGGGFGSSFFWHLHPNCVVHAVSDLIPERRDLLMNCYQCGLAYESLEKLVQDDEIEAVAVATGQPDHVRHCVAVMNAGKHVWCAVPACNTLEEAQLLLDTKKRTGLKYMLAETSYYNAYGILARELFEQGAFGELFYSEVEYSHPIDRKGLEFYRNTWRHGNAPMSYPTHGTSYLVGTTGERIVRVSGLGVCCSAELDEKELREYYGQGANRYNNPFNAEVALGKTDKGHMCRFKVIWTGQSGGERGDLFGTKMSFYTPNASSGQPFKMTGPSAPNFADPPDYAIRLPEPLRVSSGHGGAHTHLTHEFIAAIVEDREPAIDIYTGLAMTVPGIVAHRSALRGGEELKVPVFDRGR